MVNLDPDETEDQRRVESCKQTVESMRQHGKDLLEAASEMGELVAGHADGDHSPKKDLDCPICNWIVGGQNWLNRQNSQRPR